MCFLFFLIAAGCGFMLEANGSMITSPNYPSNYPNNQDKTYDISVANGKKIEITFVTFELEYQSSCSYDWLKVVDGDGSTLLEKTCGTSIPAKIISNSESVSVIFHSDYSVVRKGFSLTWKEDSTDDSMITSPNYPNNYPNNQDKTYDISVANGQKVEITFLTFNLEYQSSCSYDWLKVVDGDGSTLLEKTCGANVPAKIISNSESVSVIFHSDYSVVRKGFALQYTKKESSSDCHCGLAKRQTRIVGGIETEVNEYPWQVALTGFGANRIWCGGSLISNQWILTAAHCTEGVSPSSLQVLLGEHDSASSTESNMVRMDIEEIVGHPNYETLTGGIPNYDFSLLKMKNSIDFSSYPHIRPICLPVNGANDYNDDIATVTGWGRTSSGGPSSNKLLEVNVTVLTNTECWNDYGYSSSEITDQMLCANEVGGGKDACSGDSGGPLVTPGSGNGVTAGQNYELIGVVSWGSGCAGANFPGVYSRVSKQLDWIATTTTTGWSTCART